MKSETDIEGDLDGLIQAHYYSEDYALEWAAKHYYDTLQGDEQQAFEAVLIRRIRSNPELSEVSLCVRLALPAVLAGLLDEESESSSISRAVLTALTHHPDARAFEAVERFIDSEQEGEALMCLARMDFRRALPYLRRLMQKDNAHNFCLHALHDRAQAVERAVWLDDLDELVAPDPAMLSAHVRKVLKSTEGPYNPFSAELLRAAMERLP